MLEYVAAFLSFVAAIIAAVGQTWDNTKSGHLKFTRLGLVAIVVALSGLLLTVGVTYKKNEEQKQLERSKRMAVGTATMELVTGWAYLIIPLAEIYEEQHGTFLFSDKSPQRLAAPEANAAPMDAESLVKLQQEGYAKKISAFNVLANIDPKNNAGEKWFEYIAKQHKIGMNKLDSAIVKYGAHLDGETLYRVRAVMNHPVAEYLSQLDIIVESQVPRNEYIPLARSDILIKEWNNYIEELKRLIEHLRQQMIYATEEESFLK
jgi:hypothetical protein